MYGFEGKIDLLFCNMDTQIARKAICEKVQVCATVRECNLWTTQWTMCKKEIYYTSSQEFAIFYKIGVDADYNLISCVTTYFQQWATLALQVNVSACLANKIHKNNVYASLV